MAKKPKNKDKRDAGSKASDAAKKKGGRETTPEQGQVRREGLHTREEVNQHTSPQGKNP
jgi:hypothetical protein